MNLKFIGVGLLASVAAVSLAACSGGGSSPGVTAPQQSASTARGTLEFIAPNAKKVLRSGVRRPAYIATGFTHAELFIDSVAGGTVSNPCTPLTCTITFSTTPGTHTFAVETDDGTNILAEGSTSYTLIAGDNTTAGANLQSNPLTLNGVVYGWFLDATASGTGEIAVVDADGNNIVSAVGNYDNGPLTIVSNPAGATFVPTDSLSAMNLNGTIAFTDSCVAATTIALVVSEAAVPTPTIPLTLTGLLVYGPPAAPVLVNNGGLPNSLACP